MAKTNTLVFLSFTVIAVALFILWYATGYAYVDEPLDTIVTIVWLLIILGCFSFLIYQELARRRAVRMIYLLDGKMFNFESGLIEIKERNNITGAIADVLNSLTYSMAKPAIEPDEAEALHVQYVIKSQRFANNGKVWEGEVVILATNQVRPFASRSELARIVIPLCAQRRRSDAMAS